MAAITVNTKTSPTQALPRTIKSARTHLVELAGGELRVVCHVDALVAELPPNLVHPVEATHNEHLEVQLGRHAHVEVHAEVVVARDEGCGGGAAGDHVHHGRLHFEEGARVEEAAHELDDARAHDKGGAHGGVDEEVEVALPVPRLLVSQAHLG